MTNKGLNQTIYNFYKKLFKGTDIKVINDKDFYFCACPLTENKPVISYSLEDIETEVLKGYVKFFKKYYGEIPHCSIFTFSLLHEFGHYLTYPFLNENYIKRSHKAIERLVLNKKISPENKQARYCELYVEKAANDMAMTLIKEYPEIIKEYDKKFQKYF